MKFFYKIAICLFLLTGCSTPTKSAEATQQPTQIPISELQLDNLIIQDNDLPAGLSGAQISNDEECDSSLGQMCADYFISQELAYKDNARGHVSVWVYKNATNNLRRYQNRSDSFIAECKKSEGQCYEDDPHTIEGLGDTATMIDVYNFAGEDEFRVTFSRCNATIEINWWGVTNNPENIVTYAKRLDNRLKDVVCR